ncbi:MAG: CRISPR-associated protein Cas4 [Verrucomicrobia bacterium]|nr:CRISPR-associated protein Cas4 [Verrucomicrobiota bacterium]MBU1693352.1 CRISPR-associated protein Cas4 [Verrucomicrobiota bacterium]
MHSEDDLLPLSGLQHLLFCERRAALVHLEQEWGENRFTVEGRNLHEHVHEAGRESRNQLRIARGVRLRSLRLGLTGVADVVEFRRVEAPAGVEIPAASGRWQPFPVEYKRGRLRSEEGYAVQLCAQALCLEEMLSATILEGAIFFGATKRRQRIAFDDTLRKATEAAAARLHVLLKGSQTPPPLFEPKCEKCSLLAVCMPKVAGWRKSAARYLEGVLDE